MVYCINCGKQNKSEFDFCYNCGARLVKSGEDAPENPGVIPPATPSTPTINPDQPPPVAASPTQPLPPFPPNYIPYGTPPEPGSGPTPPPSYTGNPAASRPDYRPPYPYGYPPLPRRNENQRFPTAANGKPFVVIDHPESFYEYKNADGKQVYAAFATMQARIMAALFDTCILFLPLQTIATFILVSFNLDAQRALQSLSTTPDQAQLEEINAAMPGWAILAVYTATLIYSVLLTWKWGQTLGKRVLRIKVIGKDGGPPSFQSALNRNLFGYAYGLGSVAFGLDGFGIFVGFCLQLMVFAGFSAAFFNRQRRGWHDRLAETYVVGKTELVQGENF